MEDLNIDGPERITFPWISARWWVVILGLVTVATQVAVSLRENKNRITETRPLHVGEVSFLNNFTITIKDRETGIEYSADKDKKRAFDAHRGKTILVEVTETDKILKILKEEKKEMYCDLQVFHLLPINSRFKEREKTISVSNLVPMNSEERSSWLFSSLLVGQRYMGFDSCSS